MRTADCLWEQEIFAPPLVLEEENVRIYADHARTNTRMRRRCVDTPITWAGLQAALGGTLVFAAGLPLGSS